MSVVLVWVFFYRKEVLQSAIDQVSKGNIERNVSCRPWNVLEIFIVNSETLVVGPNIALLAMPAYRASTYQVSAFAAHSTSFSPNLSNPQPWNMY